MNRDPVRVRQWSEEVARDPASLSFLPLAAAYREDGRLDVALRLCLRGLQHHPEHVEAHFLLGWIYREQGEGVKAFDEWDITLRLDPSHRGARRALGLLCAEREDWAGACRHLEQAVADAPEDTEILSALAHARAHSSPPAAREEVGDLAALAAELRSTSAQKGVMGAVVLDHRGQVLSGELQVDAHDRAPEIAAALRGASDEASRAMGHLEMGEWTAILLETPDTVVHLSPLPESMVAVVAKKQVPTGWLIRLAARIRRVAEQFLSVPSRV